MLKFLKKETTMTEAIFRVVFTIMMFCYTIYLNRNAHLDMRLIYSFYIYNILDVYFYFKKNKKR